MCHFGHLNLMNQRRAAIVGRVDVTFCRNVLIYFDDASRTKVLDTIYQRLNRGGVFAAGPQRVAPSFEHGVRDHPAHHGHRLPSPDPVHRHAPEATLGERAPRTRRRRLVVESPHNRRNPSETLLESRRSTLRVMEQTPSEWSKPVHPTSSLWIWTCRASTASSSFNF